MDYLTSYLAGRLLASPNALSILYGFIPFMLLLAFAYIALILVAQWGLFAKVGRPGWQGLIPIYNTYVEFELFWGGGILCVVPIALYLLDQIDAISTVTGVLIFLLSIPRALKKAAAFGKSKRFAVGLIFLPTIFTLILAFGSAQYHGVPQDGYTYRDIKAKLHMG